MALLDIFVVLNSNLQCRNQMCVECCSYGKFCIGKFRTCYTKCSGIADCKSDSKDVDKAEKFA